MNCSCSQNLGCFFPGDTINFGFKAFCAGDYRFEITSRGLTVVEIVTFAAEDQITLINTFTEDGETTVKIKFPDGCFSSGYGVNYATSTNGACQFIFTSMVTTCN